MDAVAPLSKRAFAPCEYNVPDSPDNVTWHWTGSLSVASCAYEKPAKLPEAGMLAETTGVGVGVKAGVAVGLGVSVGVTLDGNSVGVGVLDGVGVAVDVTSGKGVVLTHTSVAGALGTLEGYTVISLVCTLGRAVALGTVWVLVTSVWHAAPLTLALTVNVCVALPSAGAGMVHVPYATPSRTIDCVVCPSWHETCAFTAPGAFVTANDQSTSNFPSPWSGEAITTHSENRCALTLDAGTGVPAKALGAMLA